MKPAGVSVKLGSCSDVCAPIEEEWHLMSAHSDHHLDYDLACLQPTYWRPLDLAEHVSCPAGVTKHWHNSTTTTVRCGAARNKPGMVREQ